MKQERHLGTMKKNLGLATATSTVVGCVIGSGVFFKPQAIFTATGGTPGLGILAGMKDEMRRPMMLLISAQKQADR